MSRIHRILTKAERDGTTNRLTFPPDRRRADDREVAVPSLVGSRPQPGVRSDRAAGPEVVPPADIGHVAARPVFGVKLNRLLVAALEPFSAASEHYRSLRARIAQAESDRHRRVMVVTSPGRADGKSVTAANLALAIAQEFDRRAVIVDADLRHARLHTLLGIGREPGLVDVLTGEVPLEEALVSLQGHRLVALPAGAAHSQPAELLGSAAMDRVLDQLRQRFDRILIDTAPAPTADAGALEDAADGLLLVVRAGRTSRSAIGRALGVIPPHKLIGLVLNDSRTPDVLLTA
jgi:capsular exopolysaccharide synthesis family protein